MKIMQKRFIFMHNILMKYDLNIHFLQQSHLYNYQVIQVINMDEKE